MTMLKPMFDPGWPEDVQAIYHHDVQEIWNPSLARHIWNQYHNQLSLYIALTESASTPLDILDVGCAQGTLALLLAERGHAVWAMDLRQQFLDYAASRYEKGNIHFLCANVMEATLDNRFDLIFANQIIEHLVRPIEFVQRLAGWLKPTGRLVVTTPNGRYLRSSLPAFSELGDVEQYLDRQFSADGDGHFFAYTEEELSDIFRKAGLPRIAVRHFETPFISGHMRVRHLHAFVPASLLKALDSFVLAVPVLKRTLSHQLLASGAP